MQKLLLILVFFPLLVSSQKLEKADNRELKKAYYAIEIEDYIEAYEYFGELLVKYPNNSEVRFGFGICKLHQKGNERDALEYIEAISSTKSLTNYYYYLGLAFHWNGRFLDAINCFQSVLIDKSRTIPDDDVIDAMNISYKTLELINAARNVEIDNLGNVINSPDQESVPVVLPSELGMFFTGRKEDNVSLEKDHLGNYFQDVFFTQKTDNAWSKPKNKNEINSRLHDASVSITSDGAQFLFFKSDSVNYSNGDLYIASCDSLGNLSGIEKMGAEINSQYIESSASISPDGNTIYFSSNRPEGYGGFDLYYSKRLPTGAWGTPVNMGPVINTSKNEDAPFIHADDVTLYFASDGHIGLGGFDIFSTHRSKDKIWSKPENLGYPINSFNHELYYSVSADNRKAYFSSDREGGYGKDDLYEIFLFDHESYRTVIKGVATDATNGTALNSKITIINEENKNLNGIYRSNPRNGNFIIVVRPLENYQLIVEVPGYKTEFINYSFEELKELESLTIKLQPLSE